MAILIIDLSLLFGRVSFILERKTNIQDCFGYKQTIVPPLFFKGNLIRKPNKATLSSVLPLTYSASNTSEQINSNLCAVDGKALLHAVTWMCGAIFKDPKRSIKALSGCSPYVTA